MLVAWRRRGVRRTPPLPPPLPYKLDTSRPSHRTKWTRLVHPSVLIGHVLSLARAQGATEGHCRARRGACGVWRLHGRRRGRARGRGRGVDRGPCGGALAARGGAPGGGGGVAGGEARARAVGRRAGAKRRRRRRLLFVRVARQRAGDGVGNRPRSGRVSGWYGRRDETCPVSTGGRGEGGRGGGRRGRGGRRRVAGPARRRRRRGLLRVGSFITR